MFRIALVALLLSAGVANAQLFERRQPTMIFGPNGQITTVSPTPNGFFATDTQGGMAMRQGGMVTVQPAVPPRALTAPEPPMGLPPLGSGRW